MKTTLLIVEPGLKLENPVVQTLATILGPSRLAALGEDLNLDPTIDRVVLCARGPEYAQRWLEWMRNQQDWLANVRVGLVASQQEEDWLVEVSSMLPGISLHIADMRPGSDPDIRAVITFALEMRARSFHVTRGLPTGDLLGHIEAFLQAHNTCTLATSYAGRVIATPIEYRYARGEMHLVSEGGEKFAGLLDGGRVSLAVYEPYQGFDKLAGLQLFGRACVPVYGSPDYKRSIATRDLTMEAVEKLPVLLHAIFVKLETAAFLWAGFQDMGLEPRQFYRFERTVPILSWPKARRP